MGGAAPSHTHSSPALRLVVRTAFARWRTCLALASLYAVLVGATDAVSRMSTGIIDPTTATASQVLAAGIAALAALFALMLVNVFVLPVTLGSLALIGSAEIYGDVVETRNVLRRAVDRGLELVAAFVMTLLVLGTAPIVIGLVALIIALAAPAAGFAVLIFGVCVVLVPLLYIIVRLSLALAVVMREQRGAIASLRRSWQLVRGHWWSAFGVVVFPALLLAVLSAVQSYLSFIGRDTAGDFVSGFVFSAIAAAVASILYGVGAGVAYALWAPEDQTRPSFELPEERAPLPPLAP